MAQESQHLYSDYVDAEGHLRPVHGSPTRYWNPPRGLLPTDLQEFLDGASSYVSDHVRRTVQAIAWREGRHHPVSLSIGDTTWALRDVWRPLPSTTRIGYADVRATSWTLSDVARSDLQDYVQSGAVVPIGYDLLMEARSLGSSSPRSGLLIAATAVEVGTKDFISALVPAVEWMAFNVPSPPIGTILRRYVPTLLPASNPGIPPHLIKRIEDAFSWRNDVTHGRRSKETIDRQRLQTFFADAEALLRIFDGLRGH